MSSVLILVALCFPLPTLAVDEAEEVLVYGNSIYSYETLMKESGVDFAGKLSVNEIKKRLLNTGYFSSVRVRRQANQLIIVVQEKGSSFVLPYFASSGDNKVYGLAGGLLGIAESSGMLLGRFQLGSGTRILSLMYSNEYFLDSFWSVGATVNSEKFPQDVYAGRTLSRRLGNEANNLKLSLGYHLRPNMRLRMDNYIEKHRYEELSGKRGEGVLLSHRFTLDYGSFFVNEGLSTGYNFKPYFEFANPASDFQFYKTGLMGQFNMYNRGDFNWIVRPRAEIGRPFLRFQTFDLGGATLRGYPGHLFRVDTYASAQNDFLLFAFDVTKKLRFRPLAFVDAAYLANDTRLGFGLGLNVYFRNVAVPAIQISGGYGLNPNGFSFAAAIGPQI